jgi:hypothetical protein
MLDIPLRAFALFRPDRIKLIAPVVTVGRRSLGQHASM